jgi:nickel transport protein
MSSIFSSAVRLRNRGGSAILLTAVLIAAPIAASAHGIWFAERSSQTAIIYGHGAEDSDMVKRFDKLVGIGARDKSGAPLAAQWRKTDHLVLAEMPKDVAVVTAALDNGYWSKDANDKWINKGRDEVPNPKESGRYRKFATHIFADLDKPLAPVETHMLQLVPVSAKLPHHMGETITVRVLYNGKPVAGAKVIRDYVTDPDQKPFVTGKDGVANIKVRNHGLNVIAASYDAPPDDPAKALKTGLFASLSFALRHGPE